MRVVVSSRDESVRWLPTQLDQYSGHMVAEALRDQIVFSLTESGYRHLVSEAREMSAPPQVRTRIGDLVKRVPITAKQNRPPVDVFADDLSNDANGLLLETIVHEEFQQITSQRRSSILEGESRQEVFDRHLLVYGSAATRIAFLDQYALGNIDDGHGEGLIWLCQQFVSLGVTSIVILSCLPASGNLEKSIARFRAEIQSPVALRNEESISFSIVAADHNPRGRKTGGDGPLVHDRHMRFFIGNDRGRFAPALDIGPGFDAFNRGTMSQSVSLLEVPDRRAARAREDRISQKARKSTVTFSLPS